MSLEVFVSKVFNISDEELKALIYEGEGETLKIKDDAGDILINKYATEVTKKIKDNEKGKFDQGYQKANKEVAERYKKALKEKIKFDTDKEDIDEIFDELSETIQKKIKSSLPDDQVKNHQVFLAREKELNDAINKMKEDFDTEKNTIISDYKRKENIIKVKEKAEAVLLASGAVLSEKPEVRKNQINVFLNQFEGYDYDLTGEVPLILKEGKRLEDNMMNPVKFDEFIKDQAKTLFDFKVQDPKGSGGNEGDGGSGSYSFKDRADFQAKYDSEPDRGKRMVMADAAKKAGIITI